ncbi:dedicator of cytokinesis-domain-containing protein [Chytridium lagenaria]|nr:dedicator of cytokinesis-domain-containing protein [Chytridium lagenaria]
MEEDAAPPSHRGRWCPLPKDTIWQGVVTCSFNPNTIQTSASSTLGEAPHLTYPDNPLPTSDQYISIELGDNVQLLEEYWHPGREGNRNSYDRKAPGAGREDVAGNVIWTVAWFRGYVFPSQAESSPKLGVFPESHVYCRSLIPYRKSKSTALKAGSVGFSKVGKEDAFAMARNNTTMVKNVPDSVERSSVAASSRMRTHSRSGSVSGLHPILSAGDTSTHYPPIPTSMRPTHETAAGSHEPLADEISAALREWGSLLKRHVALQDYALFSTIKTLFHLLFQGRRQLLSQTLSQEELVKYRRTLVSKLEAGNIAQGLDLIIRHPEKGHLVGEKSFSVVKLLKMHMEHTVVAGAVATSTSGGGSTVGSNGSLLSPLSASKERIDTDALRPKGVHMSFQLKSFRASICLPGEFAELHTAVSGLGNAMKSASNLNNMGSFSNLDGFHGFRRPFGCSVHDLADLYASAASAGLFGTTGSTLNALTGAFSSFYNEAVFPTLHDTIVNKGSGYEILPNSDLTVTLSLSFNLPPSPPPNAPKEEKDVDVFSKTPRLGMPEMIFPGDVRNSLYVTLVTGEFASLRLPDGTVVPDCIYRGAGYRETFYESVVYYHSNNPKWLETIRVDLDPEVLERSHLYFAIRHCSSSTSSNSKDSSDKHDRTFAFGFLPLLRADHTVINDASHSLTLLGRKLLRRPVLGVAESLSAAADAMAKAPQLKDVLVVKTALFSSRMTQSMSILNLLHWRHAAMHLGVSVDRMLRDFSNIPDYELVKFLEPIMASLIDILESADVNADGRLDDLVFSYGPAALDSRALFSIPSTNSSLTPPAKNPRRYQSMGFWIRFVVRSGLAEQRGVVAAASGVKALYGGKSFIAFQRETLQAIEALMGSPLVDVVVKFADSVRSAKTKLNGHKLAFIHTLIRGPLFADRRSRVAIVTAAVRWITESGDKENLRLCLKVATELIDRLQKVGDRLDRVRSDNEPRTPAETPGKDTHSKEEEFRKCLEVAAGVLPILLETYSELAAASETELSTASTQHVLLDGTFGALRSDKNILDDFSLRNSGFSNSPISPPQGSASTNGPSSTSSLLPPATPSHIYAPPQRTNSGTQIMTLLYVVLQSLMKGDAFPQSWAAMHVVTSRIVVKVLRPVSEVLTSDELLYSDGLDEEPAKKTRHLECNGHRDGLSTSTGKSVASAWGDVRGEAGELLRDMWEFLTGVEKSSKGLMTFIPNLVGPFLELTLTRLSREHRASGDFSRIEMECIDRMDRLVVFEGKGDDSYRRFVIEALGKQFTTATKNSVVAAAAVEAMLLLQTSLAASGARFLSAFDTFLDLIIAVRDTPAGTRLDDERIASILKLIRFLRDIGRKALYVKYIHSLARLHLSVSNNLEAALTLKLHADLLPWSQTIQVDPVPEYGFPKWQTSFERKEQIYTNCIELFEQCNHWERAAALCSELSVQYAKGWLDYMKHAEYLKRQARLIENILHQERAGEWEKLGPFCERILNKYVGAQLLRTNATPAEDITNGNGSWVQITAVNPEIDLKRWGGGGVSGAWLRWELGYDTDTTQSNVSIIEPRDRFISQTYANVEALSLTTQTEIAHMVEPDLDPKPEGAFARAQAILEKLPESIRAYYLSNEVDMFTFARPFRKPVPGALKNDPSTEFLELWTEKTLLITAHSFPCLDRRSEVVKSYVVELSPVENAVITVRAKNRQLIGLEKKYEVMALTQIGSSTSGAVSNVGSKRFSGNGGAGNANYTASRNVNLFTMALNGAVDAPVNGGVPMYRKAFLNGQYKKDNPSSGVYIDMLEKSIDEQPETDVLAVFVSVPSQMRPLHDNIAQTFLKNFPSEINRLNARKSVIYIDTFIDNIFLDQGIGQSKSVTSPKESFSNTHRRPSEVSMDSSGPARYSIASSTLPSTLSNGIGIGGLYSTFIANTSNLSSVTPHPLSQSTVIPPRPRPTPTPQPAARPRRDSSSGTFTTTVPLSGSGVVGNFAFTSLDQIPTGGSPNASTNYKRISMSSLKSNESRTSVGSAGGEGSNVSPAAKMVGGIQKLLEKR